MWQRWLCREPNVSHNILAVLAGNYLPMQCAYACYPGSTECFLALSRKLDGSIGSADKQMFGKDCLAMLGRERLATAVLICMLAQSAWALLESCMGSIGSADKQSSGKKQCRLACLLYPKKPDGSCGSVGSVDKQMLGIRHLAALGRKTLLM